MTGEREILIRVKVTPGRIGGGATDGRISEWFRNIQSIGKYSDPNWTQFEVISWEDAEVDRG